MAPNFITRENVEKAVFNEGGGTAMIDGVWAQLDPEGKGIVSPGDFAANEFIGKALAANLTQIHEAVDLKRIKLVTAEYSSSILGFTMGKADNLLAFFSRGTGTVLDLFS